MLPAVMLLPIIDALFPVIFWAIAGVTIPMGPTATIIPKAAMSATPIKNLVFIVLQLISGYLKDISNQHRAAGDSNMKTEELLSLTVSSPSSYVLEIFNGWHTMKDG
jgi:hypothetical protein